MDFENNVPEWNAPGVEPSTELKGKGFTSGYKPPAAYFNWFWNRVSLCLTEIRNKLKGHAEDKNNPHGVTAEQLGLDMLSNVFDEGVVTTGTSEAYEVTIEGIKELKVGLSFIMIPHAVSSTLTPTLNVNGLGAKPIRQPLSMNTGATTTATLPTWLSANKPTLVMYDGTLWKVGVPRPSASSIYGTIPVASGGTGIAKVTAGNFLVGNGEEDMQEKTPAEVLALIGGIALKTATATLTTSGWSDNKQTVAVSGVTATNTVFVYSTEDYKTYTGYGVRLSSQAAGSLAFECDEAPEAAIAVNVAIFG